MVRKEWQANEYNEAQNRISANAEKMKKFTQADMARATRFHRHTIEKHLRDLEGKSFLIRTGRIYYWQGLTWTWKMNSTLLEKILDLPEGSVLLKRGDEMSIIPAYIMQAIAPDILNALKEIVDTPRVPLGNLYKFKGYKTRKGHSTKKLRAFARRLREAGNEGMAQQIDQVVARVEGKRVKVRN